MQKRIISIMFGCKESCTSLFKRANILPLKSQYLLSLVMFVPNNLDHFVIYRECHNKYTRHVNDLHLPQANLTTYQKELTTLVLKFLIGSQLNLRGPHITVRNLKVL
jgi:hypothetical protein